MWCCSVIGWNVKFKATCGNHLKVSRGRWTWPSPGPGRVSRGPGRRNWWSNVRHQCCCYSYLHLNTTWSTLKRILKSFRRWHKGPWGGLCAKGSLKDFCVLSEGYRSPWGDSRVPGESLEDVLGVLKGVPRRRFQRTLKSFYRSLSGFQDVIWSRLVL